MSDSPYAKAPAKKLAEVNRLAEARLSAQLTLALAADQRAMTMASILAAIDAAIIGLIAASEDKHGALIVLACGFALAAGLAAWSASPIAWEIPGSEPSNWLEDIEEGDSLHNGQAAMADFYDKMISDNADQITSNANHITLAFVVMIFSLIVSGFLALLGR